MVRPALEVADVLRSHLLDYPHILTQTQARVLRALQVCRTAHLGGHVERCDGCGNQRNAYNSCRNRHCPKCQSLAKAEWVEKQVADLLPVPYFHVVFTMPPRVAELARQNPEVVYDILFRAAAETLQGAAGNPKFLGAEIGLLAVLHTWGQNLHYHPHVHCLVPGGGLSPDNNRWVGSRKKFFLPVKVLSRLYRGRFLAHLVAAHQEGRLTFHGELARLTSLEAFRQYLAPVRTIDWVVYSKPPFGGPEQVVQYIGRYTHRVAISNHRLVNLEDGRVAFRWRDYRDGNSQKVMTLSAHDFIGRFIQHILPERFVRLRSYGILSTRNRPTKLARCRELLQAPAPETARRNWKELLEELTGRPIDACRACNRGKMETLEKIPSTRELEQQAMPGIYHPRLLLSQIQQQRWLQRLDKLKGRLDSS